jgi:hypothetical protein
VKRHEARGLEFNVGPHPVREGWEVARITYDPANPAHERQVEAAITALVQARGVRASEQSELSAPLATAGGGAT